MRLKKRNTKKALKDYKRNVLTEDLKLASINGRVAEVIPRKCVECPIVLTEKKINWNAYEFQKECADTTEQGKR